MASIFTGLAFMHGHIVDLELVLYLGRQEPSDERGRGASTRAPVLRPSASEAPCRAPAPPACARC